MSDGTPLTTTSRRRRNIDGQLVQRSGKSSKEYLTERLCLIDCSSRATVLYRDPSVISD